MSFVRIWVHVIFSTKNHYPYLNSEQRAKLIEHILSNARSKDIYIDSIGGWSEHLHILFSLGREQNISKVIMLIKGESSRWLNSEFQFGGKFYWQDDYYAISVSESQLERVRKYIRNQETHHATKSFQDELNQLRKLAGDDTD